MSEFSQRIAEKKLLYRVIHHHDADAFAALYDVYIDQIYRFVYLKVSSQTDAEDLCSDVFLTLWERLKKKQTVDIKHLRGFIYTIARNKIIDLYRERAKTQSLAIEQVPDIESDEDIESAIQQSQERDILLAQLDKLKEVYKEVIVLRYIEEYSISEIAKIMNKKKTNVRVLLHRAVKKLEQLMNKS